MEPAGKILTEQAQDAAGGTPDQYRKLLQSDSDRVARLIKEMYGEFQPISAPSFPPASEVYLSTPSAWAQYRVQIFAILAALLTQAALIFLLIYEHRRRRLAEIQSRNSMAELTQLNRLATAGELSGAIAHEVKQPLTAMVTRANAALRWLSGDNPNIGRARDALGQIVSAAHRASDIVTNVRAMFGKDTEEKIPTDVNELTRTVLGLVYMDLRKHSIESRVELSEQALLVLGNKVQLQQVILNLAMNAIESMSSVEPRVLSIKTESTDHSTVLVSIADTGNGIAVSDLNRIFKPMFTTKAGGMGMGLSICKSIIENHNGRIWVSAAVPRGSVFHFELPMYQSDQRKFDLSGRMQVPTTGGPASTPALADEIMSAFGTKRTFHN
jgi:C4-dicarboxylate-specific signal transduction histidine kinase